MIWIKKALPLLVVAAFSVAYCANEAKDNREYSTCRKSGQTPDQCLDAKKGATGRPLETTLSPALPVQDEIQVTEASEYVKGFTFDAIDERVIAAMEALLIKDAQAKYAVRASEAGRDADSVQFSATSIKFDDNGQQGVVTQLHISSQPQRVHPSLKLIWSVQDSQLKRVYCIDPLGSDINIRRGTCGRQIAKTFSYDSWLRS